MRAIVLHEFGPASNLSYEDHEDAKLKEDEVLVAVTVVGVNPVDWKIRSGSEQQRIPIELPTILGRDAAGTVCAVGAGVAEFAAGDRVMAFASQPTLSSALSKLPTLRACLKVWK